MHGVIIHSSVPTREAWQKLVISVNLFTQFSNLSSSFKIEGCDLYHTEVGALKHTSRNVNIKTYKTVIFLFYMDLKLALREGKTQAECVLGQGAEDDIWA
jgi:hypothetical protein